MNTQSVVSRRKVMVAAPTYKRNDLLDGLLKSLNELVIPADTDVTFIIIDNDPARGAEAVVAKWQAQFSAPLHYHTEAEPGVTHVRNRALDLAAGHDLLAFIDDDEFADPQWLAALIARYEATHAAAVFGPVDPVYPDTAPGWMRDWAIHGTSIPADEDQMKPGATCNCLIDLGVVRETGLRFETRMSLTGGEDTLFFTRLLDAGYRLTRASGARVFEHIPEGRATPKWLMRRWYRTGITDALIAGRDMSPGAARARGLAHGLLRVATGSAAVAVVAIASLGNPRQVLARCYTVCRGAGMVTFAFGKQYEEYGRAK
ncbi:MAG: glycosyltransferase family 2 protein [Hyphomonas sp.]|uniref:glycosyltransferase family 2 protein n=1 Tax=Hyphomonas sp. TaxID=87 RepID=UPI0035290639